MSRSKRYEKQELRLQQAKDEFETLLLAAFRRRHLEGLDFSISTIRFTPLDTSFRTTGI